MNIPRFFIAPEFIDHERQIVICQAAKLVRQVRKVLRLENGDKIDILDGQGNIYHCTLKNILTKTAPDVFQASIISQEKILQPQKTIFTVALPLIKPSRFEWALEKLTELGVDVIVPVVLHRSVIKIESDNKNARLTRWQKIIQESAEQSERASAPQLVPPLKFLDWLSDNKLSQDSTLRLICAERKEVQPLHALLCNHSSLLSYSHCAIAIGAEGGFTEEELEAALSYKFTPVSLGSHILRSETAAIYALSITRTLLGLESPNTAQ